MAARDERHHSRHTKRTGGVRTTRLGAIQRTLLVSLMNATWVEQKRRESQGAKSKSRKRPPTDAWLRWQPTKDPPTGFAESDAPALSRAVSALEKRRLLMTRRHVGGRVYAVRLSEPGWSVALELQRFSGRTAEQSRQERARQLPAEVRAAVPKAYAELRSAGLQPERREVLRRFVELYDEYTGDPGFEERGTGNLVPGIGEKPTTLTELYAAFAVVTSSHQSP